MPNNSQHNVEDSQKTTKASNILEEEKKVKKLSFKLFLCHPSGRFY